MNATCDEADMLSEQTACLYGADSVRIPQLGASQGAKIKVAMQLKFMSQ